jgi:hypothetical protein
MPFNYEAPRRFSVPFTYTIEDVLAMDPSGAVTVRDLLTHAALHRLSREANGSTDGMRLEYVEIVAAGGRPKEGIRFKDDFDPYTIAVFLHYIEGREE